MNDARYRAASTNAKALDAEQARRREEISGLNTRLVKAEAELATVKAQIAPLRGMVLAAINGSGPTQRG